MEGEEEKRVVDDDCVVDVERWWMVEGLKAVVPDRRLSAATVLLRNLMMMEI